jgi:hypothetical protein
MGIWAYLSALIVFVVTALIFVRLGDERTERRAWVRLQDIDAPDGAVFHQDLVSDLPEPARRFFLFAIRPGTRIYRVSEIEMHGQIGLGTKSDPRYQPMLARQILAPLHGFVWLVKTRRLRGSDGMVPGHSWSRFSMFGLVPVARASGPDHLRASFGRAVAEGLFWCPGALLPGPDVSWKATGPDRARVTVRCGDLTQSAEMRVGPDGRPEAVVMLRWSNANPTRRWQMQPFGGKLSQFRTVDGYCLPTQVIGGNFFGTDNYFPFFRAEVTSIRFPDRD